MKPNGGPGAPADWSSQIREVTVSAQITDSHLVLDLAGGADSGRFCLLNSVDEKRCVLWHGSLQPNSVVLEIQGHKVSGFTLRDVRELVEKLSRNGSPIMVKTVPAACLPTELRDFLGAKFQVDSADYALQNTIRENLYLRTVPVTTRKKREHEIDGVDYQFLTVEQFLEMERSGQLLESGLYEGNRYGTPKPSADATGLFRGGDLDGDVDGSGGGGRGTAPDGSIRRLRSQSSSEAVEAASVPGGAAGGGGDSAEDEVLPDGWEKVVDPKYGVFYIDHINKKTQYERPSVATPAAQGLPQSRSFTNGLAQHAVAASQRPAGTASATASSNPAASGRSIQFRGIRQDPGMFTANPSRLAGELLTVRLVKSPGGLGITIVGGGDRAKPEFLQVKSLVPGGPAAEDGRLQSGDVLVYVNEQLVLGGTHEDLISLFRQIEPGQLVTLTVSTGYRLPVSASDPRAEVITKVAAALDTNGAGSQRSSHSGSSGLGSPGQAGAALAGMSGMSLGRAELIKAVINRSVAGFGFTIADSPQGQRIRQIVDESRCRGLQPGDLLIEVNSRRVKELPHTDVVRILAECPIGQDCSFLLQRGSLPQASAAGPPTFRTSASHSGGLASLADSATAAVGFGHSSFLPPSAGSGPSSSSGGAAISNFSRHAPLRSSRPDTGSSSVTVTAYPPPASSAASSGSTAGTVPRFRSRTPGPETSLSGSAFDDQQQQQQQPARPRTPTGLVEGRGYHQQQQVQQLHPQPPSASAATAGYGSLGRRPRAAAAAAAPQFTVTLLRNQLGLGIRILGGAEEGSQVTIGQLVPGSAAHADGRIRPGDEIVSVNGTPCVAASHHRVVQLLESAGPRVSLGLRRNPVLIGDAAAPVYPYDVTLTRRQDEGFGIVIVSSVTRPPAGSGGGVVLGEFIGHIIDGSPASRCDKLRRGDRILAVNGVGAAGVHHEDIVRMVRDSGLQVRLTVGPPLPGQAGAPPPGLIGRAVAGPASQSSGSPEPASVPAVPPGGLFTAVLHKTDKGFGFSIRGGAEFNQMPFYVLRIAEGGGAHQSGRLRVGDEIVSINDRPLAGITHTEAIQVIRSAGSTLKLVCRRPVSAGPAD
ncbi:hypothetical protein BOX15_Mlig012730g4 [Macrostomum lignano]|uniref:Uncharacterized protein n=1 Tax=Macrostomum lignano TaxID=282301 RepID=A0A267GHD4_9PLAT|nr:hypothetical protein BOX15_Mlig012730g4 [Macrostomum lignano]